MKIKQLMDQLNRGPDSPDQEKDNVSSVHESRQQGDENVTYIENARLETVSEQAAGRDILVGRTQWSDQAMGEILVSSGKLSPEDVETIIRHQHEKGLYFGEAAIELQLVEEQDILQALSLQFGYTYNSSEEQLAREMVMAHAPFGEQAEEFRSIRAQLLSGWLTPRQKTLAIVSPENQEGRSYVAANLALAFSQLGRPTLLIDADLRAPHQHDIFQFTRRIGLSMLLAGRVRMEDLDALPDRISSFQSLSVLGCGAVPPNPVELLSQDRFRQILNELEKFFDVIIIDTPPATYQADVMSIASVAGSALLVARSGHTKIDKSKDLVKMLNELQVNVAGAVINQF